MSYDNTNRGVLGRNLRKEKETHPDYTGSINVNGTNYWLNAWVKENERGKFFSLSVREKEGNDAPAPQKQSQAAAQPSFDDASDIPF